MGRFYTERILPRCADVAHFAHYSTTGEMPMNTILVAGLSLALALAVVALVRQVRLRRALQSLLFRFLKHWRE